MNLALAELKFLRSLQQKKFRETSRKFLLEGWRPLIDALHSDFTVELIAVLPEAARKPEHREVIALARNHKIPVKDLSAKQLSQISDSVHSQGVLALVRQKANAFDAGALQTARFIVACDRLSDPGNMGTIVRTCDWFGVDAVLMNAGCVSLYNDKVIRSTAGSIFHLNVFEGVDLGSATRDLKSRGFTILGSTLEGKPVQSFTYPKKTVLLLGSEAHGISPDLTREADELLCIQRVGRAESLNVGIACGILLAQWRHQEGQGK